MPKHWPTWFGFAAGLTALSLCIASGSSLDEGWKLAARWTGRAAFPLFIVTFVASSLALLVPRPWTRTLLRDRRWWGLGFAACFAVHLLALSVFNWRMGKFPPVDSVNAGVLAYALLLAMALTSSGAAQRRLGRGWTWLHRTGMWIFLVIFGWPGEGPIDMTYTLIALSAAGLRVAAWWQRRRHRAHPWNTLEMSK
jgi:DMSO/TMAO reductase YedYZ heme-binding membrane subunit